MDRNRLKKANEIEEQIKAINTSLSQIESTKTIGFVNVSGNVIFRTSKTRDNEAPTHLSELVDTIYLIMGNHFKAEKTVLELELMAL